MRFFILSVLFVSLCGAVLAQSGRNKSNGEPSRPKPLIELPSQQPAKTIPPPPPLPPLPPSAPDEDVIKIDATLVPIPVSVTDANGNAVTNLKLSDFELKVDGAVAEVSDMTHSETPVRLALLFDNSSSVSSAREFEIKAATRFFKKVLRPNRDQAALYSVATEVRLEQRLTGDISQLLSAIQRFPPSGGATALFDAIVAAANYLSESKNGRRVIVIVSDGSDTLSDINLTLEAVIKKTQLADCQVYVVQTTGFENFRHTGQRGINSNTRDLIAERRMQELAAQTGGAVYAPLDEREMDAAFAQIAAELSEQYVLSYYPTEQKHDGSFKQISVAVKTSKNLTIRTRKGYYLPKS
jgi:Ca-activated chloride channel family protein